MTARTVRSTLWALVASFALLIPLAPASSAGSEPEAADDAVIVFLVRHAEKVPDGSRDPALTDAGRERARELARMLGPRIDRVHSTDYRRTRDTAGPVAQALGTEVELYDPRRLSELAGRLRDAPGRHLVVGHSNTTPDLIRALGGEVGEPVTEAHYDRLWIVTVPASAAPPSTVELRYGAADPGPRPN